MDTIRLTMAQALVRYLVAQRTIVDGQEVSLFPGVFAIFGHGNVTCLGEALETVRDVMPTWRGQNEQTMALAAVAFAKAKRRRQIIKAQAFRHFSRSVSPKSKRSAASAMPDAALSTVAGSATRSGVSNCAASRSTANGISTAATIIGRGQARQSSVVSAK